jgi:hypothetical protein
MTAPDFSHLARLQVSSDRTARYTVAELEGEPVLEIAPATEANKPYFNALLKRVKGVAQRIKGGQMTATMLAENRAEDADLYPGLVVRGWPKAPLDASGKPVPWSQDACRAFLQALPGWIFDNLRKFASDPRSFLQPDEASPEEGDPAGG